MGGRDSEKEWMDCVADDVGGEMKDRELLSQNREIVMGEGRRRIFVAKWMKGEEGREKN